MCLFKADNCLSMIYFFVKKGTWMKSIAFRPYDMCSLEADWSNIWNILKKKKQWSINICIVCLGSELYLLIVLSFEPKPYYLNGTTLIIMMMMI